MVIHIKTLKSNLSNNELNSLINKLQQLKSGLQKSGRKIVKDMSDFAKEQISQNLAATPYKDGNDDVRVYSEVKNEKTKVGMTGTQVLYDEFGTGTKGQESPHPDKGKFQLRGYNTGSKIKVSKNGDLFWIYKNSNGELVKTNGIPAGKQVFNASILLKGKKNQIIKRRVGEVISKL